VIDHVRGLPHARGRVFARDYVRFCVGVCLPVPYFIPKFLFLP